MIVVIVIITIVLFLFYGIGTYNKILAYKISSDNSWKQIDVQIKRRYDLIPNIVEIARGYLKYEQETLVKVMEARNKGISLTNPKDVAKAEGEISGLLRQLFAVVENYPDLKANENMMRLQEELTSTENKISFSRQHYNDVVANYNFIISRVPSNLVANMCNFKEKEYFNIEEKDKEVPKISI